MALLKWWNLCTATYINLNCYCTFSLDMVRPFLNIEGDAWKLRSCDTCANLCNMSSVRIVGKWIGSTWMDSQVNSNPVFERARNKLQRRFTGYDFHTQEVKIQHQIHKDTSHCAKLKYCIKLNKPHSFHDSSCVTFDTFNISRRSKPIPVATPFHLHRPVTPRPLPPQ